MPQNNSVITFALLREVRTKVEKMIQSFHFSLSQTMFRTANKIKRFLQNCPFVIARNLMEEFTRSNLLSYLFGESQQEKTRKDDLFLKNY
jgi:hypothetical protein